MTAVLLEVHLIISKTVTQENYLYCIKYENNIFILILFEVILIPIVGYVDNP
jgi:hypothetical protein